MNLLNTTITSEVNSVEEFELDKNEDDKIDCKITSTQKSNPHNPLQGSFLVPAIIIGRLYFKKNKQNYFIVIPLTSKYKGRLVSVIMREDNEELFNMGITWTYLIESSISLLPSCAQGHSQNYRSIFTAKSSKICFDRPVLAEIKKGKDINYFKVATRKIGHLDLGIFIWASRSRRLDLGTSIWAS